MSGQNTDCEFILVSNPTQTIGALDWALCLL